MRVALVPAVLLLAAACGAKDVVVAYEVEAGARPCTTEAECHKNEACVKAACGATSGTCERRPDVCPNDGAPVCGCDGISYWNDCLRRQAGVAAATQGACPIDSGAPCGGKMNAPCANARASCARLLPPGPCPPDARGTCWILPDTCPAATVAWLACGPQPMQCVDTCTAIRSGQPAHTPGQGCP